MVETLRAMGEFAAAGLYEQPDRSLFFRKAVGLRRFYETCPLPTYIGKPLYPSGQAAKPDYYTGMAVDLGHVDGIDRGCSDRIRGEFYRYRSSVPSAHTVAGNMWIHSMPHYERVLSEGLDSYAARIRRINDRDMREGLLELLAGITAYLSRCVAYLESVDAEPRLVAALRHVPFRPARNIYEAVVAWNVLLYLDSCDNLGCVAAGLAPYHKGEYIVPLLENLFDNLDVNNGYSMALHTDDGALVLQCLEAAKGKRRPMIELFVDESTPKEVWDKACQLIRSGGGQPAFYNPRVLLGGLQRRFPSISDEDIRRYCGGGCTESMIAGMSNVGSLDAGINLPLIFERVLYEVLPVATTFEAFYDAYVAAVAHTVEEVTAAIAVSQRDRARYDPVPMRTLLVDDCIENGVEFHAGGARYKWSIINFAGLINVIDGMLSVRELVFRRGQFTAGEMLERLRQDDETFVKLCRNCPVAYGRDDADADKLAGELSAAVFATLRDKKPAIGEGFIPACIQFESQVRAGKPVGATPDGRRAGAPLCDSMAAIFSKDTVGPTALLNSVTSLDLKQALGVPVLNFNLQPDFSDTLLKALILGYMDRGGIQMQLTCISREMLEEAYRHPEEHKNLVVRVAGYSEYFYRLSDELKRVVIERTIQKGC